MKLNTNLIEKGHPIYGKMLHGRIFFSEKLVLSTNYLNKKNKDHKNYFLCAMHQNILAING
jgi:hypothetical protein